MLTFGAHKYDYVSHRNAVYARLAMACTSIPQTAQIGMEAMRHGGNTVDTAIAMAAAIPLLELMGNRLGSDTFMLVWIENDKRLLGLNASGSAPIHLTAEHVRTLGF